MQLIIMMISSLKMIKTVTFYSLVKRLSQILLGIILKTL
jgi:hypothetical protein